MSPQDKETLRKILAPIKLFLSVPEVVASERLVELLEAFERVIEEEA